MKIPTDPEHPILPGAWQYQVTGLNFDLDPDDGGESRLDLKLRRQTTTRVFRFWSPSDLEIERGGPQMTSGLVILDLSGRGLEDINVQVADFEASEGAVSFVARAVEEL